MTRDDEHLRDALFEYVRADEPPMRATSAALIAEGRRRRRGGRAAALTGTVAAVLAVLAGAAVWTVWSGPDRRPAAATATARRIDAALRDALPSRGRLVLRTLEPGADGTPLPTAAASSATAWHGVWESTVDGRVQVVRVDVGFTAPAAACGGTDCQLATGPYGTSVATFRSDGGLWAVHRRTDTFGVRVGDEAPSGTGFRFGRAELARAATSAALTIPAPAGLRVTHHAATAPAGFARILDDAVRGGLPGGAGLRTYQPPVGLSADATGPRPTTGPADFWYADWTIPGQPGGPRITLRVDAPGTTTASRSAARALCGDASCSPAPSAHGGWTVTYEQRTGEAAVRRTAVVVRPDGSRVLLAEEVQATVDFPYDGAELLATAADPTMSYG
ncbi:MAG TPA: hypothetical protein VGN37_01040 [Actinocatenispora sp.]